MRYQQKSTRYEYAEAQERTTTAMWCHDIGLERAANRPLLKTIFEIMMRLFSPRKRTLHIVIRDKTTKTLFERLESKLREDVEKIWETVQDHQGLEETPLNEIFNVEITALSHYELERDMFEEEVAQLRRNFFSTISPRCSGERQQDVQLPTSKLPFSRAKEIWDSIKEYKGHELSPFKVMVATVGCEAIAKEKLRLFESNEEWLALQQETKTGLVTGFGAKISLILSRYLSEYDYESIHFEKDVRKAKRQYLTSEALKVVHPAYMNTLGHLRSEAVRSFKTQLEAVLSEGGRFAESVRTCHQSCVFMFNRQFSDHAALNHANWDASTVRQELLSDLESHKILVLTKKLSQTENQQRERLTSKLARQLVNILNDHDDDDKWASIRSVLKSESETAESALRSAVDMFELERPKVEEMADELKQYARNLVETIFKDQSRDARSLMEKRFIMALKERSSVPSNDGSGNSSSWVRNWCRWVRNLVPVDAAACGGNTSFGGGGSPMGAAAPTRTDLDPSLVPSAKKEAYRECVKLLSTLAVIRLDEKYDNVERVLLHFALMDANSTGVAISPDLLSSITWEEVPPEMTLITPVECRDIWNQFQLDMERQLANAKYVQEQCEKQKKHFSFPTWAIVGLSVLGDYAFTLFLRQMNIDVPLALSLAAKAVALGVLVVDGGISKCFEYMEQGAENITEFRIKYPMIMEFLERSLQELYILFPIGFNY